MVVWKNCHLKEQKRRLGYSTGRKAPALTPKNGASSPNQTLDPWAFETFIFLHTLEDSCHADWRALRARIPQSKSSLDPYTFPQLDSRYCLIASGWDKCRAGFKAIQGFASTLIQWKNRAFLYVTIIWAHQAMSVLLFYTYTTLDTFRNLSFPLPFVITCEGPGKLVIPMLQVKRTWQRLTNVY